jgi:hypothetical protein
MPLGAVAVVLCLLYLLYNREATPLRNIPGPFLASISQIWIVRQQRGLQRPLVDLALHKKYGPIVRIAPNEVIVSSPQSKKTIYGESALEVRNQQKVILPVSQELRANSQRGTGIAEPAIVAGLAMISLISSPS